MGFARLPGFSMYDIYDDGRIYSRITNKFLNMKKSNCDPKRCYYSIRLRGDDFKQKSFYVHRLVAELFCEKKEGMNQVDHVDCNKLNNNYTNLEWVNNSINQKRAFANGLNTGRLGKPASEETKEKMRLGIKKAWQEKDPKEKEEFAEKCRQRMLGHSPSEETRKKLSETSREAMLKKWRKALEKSKEQ